MSESLSHHGDKNDLLIHVNHLMSLINIIMSSIRASTHWNQRLVVSTNEMQ